MITNKLHHRKSKTLFINRVNEISTILGINPDWLMLDMYHESGLDSSAVNPNGGQPA